MFIDEYADDAIEIIQCAQGIIDNECPNAPLSLVAMLLLKLSQGDQVRDSLFGITTEIDVGFNQITSVVDDK